MRSKLASSIAILLNYGAKWRALYYIFYVLCLDLELSIILNGRYLFSDIENSNASGSGTTQSKSFFAYFLRTFDIFNIKLKLTSAFFMLCIYLALAGYFWYAVLVKPSTHWRRAVQGRFTSRIIMVLLLGNYFFLIFIGCQTTRLFYCSRAEVHLNTEKAIIGSTEAFISAFFKNLDKKTHYKWTTVSTMIPNLECYSTPHVVLIILASAACFLAVCMKLFYIKLVNSTFITRFLAESLHIEWFRVLIYISMAIIRLGYRLATETDISNTKYFYIGIALSSADYLLHVFVNSFISKHENLLRSLDAGLVLFCVSSLAIERKFAPDALNAKDDTSMNSLYIFEALMLVLLLKLTIILKNYDFSKMFVLDKRVILPRSLEELSFGCLAYLEEFTEAKWNKRLLKRRLVDRLFTSLVLFKSKFPRENLLIETLACLLKAYISNKSFHIAPSEFASRKDLLDLGPITIEGNFFPTHESVMSTVEENRNLEFKEVVNLLDIVLTVYFRVTSTTHLQASSKMVAILSHFNLVYKVRPLLAVETMRQRVRAGYARDIDLMIVEQVIKLRIEDALKTGSYFLAGRSHHLTFNTTQLNKIDMSRVEHFLQKMEDLKSSVSKLLKMKVETSKAGLEEQFEPALLYYNAHKFREIVGICERLLLSLVELVGETASTPLLMLEAFFRVHLIFENRRGFILAQNLAQKPFRCGFRNLTYVEYLQDRKVVRHALEKLVIIGVSAERDTFHQITSATSNAPIRLGFTSAELLGSDLACLVSEPIRSRHAELMRPEKGRGVLLEQKTEQEMYVKTKHGWVQMTRVALRLHAERDGGVVVMARLNCEDEGEDVAQLIITSDLRIAEVNRQGFAHFQAKSLLKNYSSELTQWVSEVITASESIYSNQKEPDTLNKSQNSEEAESMELHLYLKLKVGREMQVEDRHGDQIKVSASVQEIYFRATKELVYVISYKVILAGLSPCRPNFNEKIKEGYSCLVTSPQLISTMGNVSLRKLRSNVLKKAMKYSNTSQENIDGSIRANLSTTNYVTFGVAKLDTIIKKRVMARMNLMLRRSPTSKQAAPQYHQSKTQKRRVVRQAVDSDDIRKPVKEQSLADVSSTHTMRLTNMGKSLSAKLGFQQLYNMLLIGSVVICLIFVAELIFSHITYSRGIRKYREIGKRVNSMDTASWSLFSVNAFQTITNFNRLVLDKAIPNDYFAEYGITNLLEWNTKRKYHTQNWFYQYFTNSMMNINDMIADRPEEEIRRNLSIKVRTQVGKNELSIQKLSQIEAMKTTHTYQREYIKRDDLNAWNTTSESEEALTYNLLNGMLDLAMELTIKTNQYVLYMSTEIIHCAYLCCFSPTIGMSVLLVFAAFRYYFIKWRLTPVIKNMINFKCKDLQLSIVVLERQSRWFGQISRDEYSAYPKLSKYLVQGSQLEDANHSQHDLTKSKLTKSQSTRKGTEFDTQMSRGMSTAKPYTHVELTTRAGIRKSNFSFGMGWNYFLFTFLLVIWAGIRWIATSPEIKNAHTLNNLISVYDLMVDVWNMNSNLQTILLSEIALGTQIDVGYRPAAKEFDYFFERLSKQLMPKISKMKNKNLGLATLEYAKYFSSNFTICNNPEAKPQYFAYCHQKQAAIFDGNFEIVLTKIIGILGSSQTIIQKSNNNSERYQMLIQPYLKSYLFYSSLIGILGTGISEEIYVSVMVGVAPAINEIVNLMVYFTGSYAFLIQNICISFIIFGIAALAYKKQVLIVPKNCLYTIYLFEPSLLETNAWLMNKAKQTST